MALFAPYRRAVARLPGAVQKAKKPWWWKAPTYLLPPDLAARQEALDDTAFTAAIMGEGFTEPPQWFKDSLAAGDIPAKKPGAPAPAPPVKPWWHTLPVGILPPDLQTLHAALTPEEKQAALLSGGVGYEPPPDWFATYVGTGQLPPSYGSTPSPIASPKPKPWWWGQSNHLLPPDLQARQATIPIGDIVAAQSAGGPGVAEPPEWFWEYVKTGKLPASHGPSGAPPVAPAAAQAATAHLGAVKVPTTVTVPPGVSQLPTGHQQAWEDLHAVADAARPGLQSLVLQTWQQAEVNLDASTLMQLLTPGQQPAAEQALQHAFSQAIDTHFGPKLQQQLQDLFLQGAKASLPALRESLHQLKTGLPGGLGLEQEEKLKLVGDLMGPRAANYAQQSGSQLITNLTTQSREAIRLAVAQATARGTPIGMLTQTIRGVLETVPAVIPSMTPGYSTQFAQAAQGLLPRQVSALGKYRQGLFLKGWANEKIETATLKKASQYRRQRAEMIARTETITATAAGQQALWEASAQQGLLDTSRAKRRWVITPDDRMCPSCGAIPGLNPEGVGLKEPFTTPNGPVMHPAAHPRCRCAVVLVFDLKAPLSLPELVNPVIPKPPPKKPKPVKEPPPPPAVQPQAWPATAPPPVVPPPPPPKVKPAGQPPPKATTPKKPAPAVPPAQGSQTWTAQSPSPLWATQPEDDFWLQQLDVPISGVPPLPSGKVSSGVVMLEDGKVWIYEPKGHYGGYSTTFPKGALEPHLTPQQNALKEVWEETGLQAKITGFLGDFKATTGTTRLYLGTKIGGDPTTFGPETASVKLLTPADLEQALKAQGQTYPLQALQALKDQGLIPHTPVPTVAPPPPPPPPTAPATAKLGTMAMADAQGTFVEKLGGSTGAERWTGTDGVDRAVKRPRDVLQGYVEAVSNRAYTGLGVQAPDSVLLTEQDKLVGVGNGWVEGGKELGKLQLTQARAREVLKGYVGDVWLKNWDTIGLDKDNIKFVGDKALRVDQGGALMFKATGGRKPGSLHDISEFETFQDPAINKNYAEVFKAANYTKAEQAALFREQGKALQALRQATNDFADLVPQVAGIAAADRDTILQMLRVRATLLVEKLAALEGGGTATGDLKAAMIAAMGQREYDRALARVQRRSGWKNQALEEHEKVALNAYSSEHDPWCFRQMNDALWDATSTPEKRAKYGPINEAATNALAKLPHFKNGTLWRGAKHSAALDARVAATYKIGATIKLDGFNSTTSDESVSWGFGTAYHYVLTVQDGGANIKPYSEYGYEAEYLWPPNSEWHITKMEKRGGTLWIWATQVPPQGEPPVAPKKRTRRVTKAAFHHPTESERQAQMRRGLALKRHLEQHPLTGEAAEAAAVHARKVESCELTVHFTGMAPDWMNQLHHVDPTQIGLGPDDLPDQEE
jgi:8-oxo-dGTP pyrophosphatase MutT (NUDIX family)